MESPDVETFVRSQRDRSSLDSSSKSIPCVKDSGMPMRRVSQPLKACVTGATWSLLTCVRGSSIPWQASCPAPGSLTTICLPSALLNCSPPPRLPQAALADLAAMLQLAEADSQQAYLSVARPLVAESLTKMMRLGNLKAEVGPLAKGILTSRCCVL